VAGFQVGWALGDAGVARIEDQDGVDIPYAAEKDAITFTVPPVDAYRLTRLHLV
jgi:hypothetical protein